MSRQPVVVIVGRPNVGKSTLFNRLTRSRRALVHDQPGVTRDRIIADAERPGGGRVTVVDTGGLLLEDEDQYVPLIRSQAEEAIRGADAVVFLLDGESGPIPEDRDIANYLRALGVPVVPVVNKADRSGVELGAPEFNALGLGEPVLISAEHGRGTDELWEALDGHLGVSQVADEQPDRADEVQVAIIGRPNVGKSSLLNRLVGDERALVSEIAGTTRDAVDCLIERGGQRYLIVDTAGIRKGRLLKENVDHVSVVQARHSIERADVVVLVLDAEAGVREMDATIAGLADKAGRGVVIAVNKWDLAAERGLKQRSFTESVRDDIKFISWAPLVFVSARTGMGIAALLKKADAVGVSCRQRVTTGQVNRVLGKAAREHAPKAAKGGAPVSILYGAQVGIAPPTFAISISHPVDLHFSYKRFLENRIRAAFGFEGAPIVIKVRARRH